MLNKEDIQMLQEMFAKQEDVITEKVTQGVTKEMTRLIRVLLDAEVTPRFNLLAEGQQAIIDRLDRLEPEKRFAEMDDDNVVLRAAVKQLARDVQALKRQAN